MNLSLEKYINNNYISSSQKTRVMTEPWYLNNGYCVNCFSSLSPFENNSPVADFYCSFCKEEFELKSKRGMVSKKIVDGAYHTMITRVNSNNNPNLIFLNYSIDLSVNDIIAIPKYFFTERIIEKRKPLSENAKRAGWVGCNILYSEIPEVGKIFLVKNKIVVDKKVVKNNWENSKKFKIDNLEKRGWTLEVLKIADKMKQEFTLQDVYKYEKTIKIMFPENNHIKDKLRQQLQILRDKKHIEFLGDGKYRKLSLPVPKQ